MDELLDIVNDQDMVIDQQMRSTVHEQGLQHRGVHVFLFTNNGKMLIQKRSADRAAEPSALDCSISEHVKAGESYLDAAVRGLKEEMGLDGIAIRELTKFKMNYGPNDNEISTLYEGTVDPAKVTFDREEIEAISYHTIAELEKMMEEPHVKFCGWFVEILNWYLKKPAKLQVLPV
jgi:isopentenyl-diphosphate delta-isomerase